MTLLATQLIIFLILLLVPGSLNSSIFQFLGKDFRGILSKDRVISKYHLRILPFPEKNLKLTFMDMRSQLLNNVNLSQQTPIERHLCEAVVPLAG